MSIITNNDDAQYEFIVIYGTSVISQISHVRKVYLTKLSK